MWSSADSKKTIFNVIIFLSARSRFDKDRRRGSTSYNERHILDSVIVSSCMEDEEVVFEPSKSSFESSSDSMASTSSEMYLPQVRIPTECRIVKLSRNYGQSYKDVFEKDKSYVQWVLQLRNCTGKILDLQDYFKKPYECSGCRKIYKSKQSLRNHKSLGRCKGLKQEI